MLSTIHFDRTLYQLLLLREAEFTDEISFRSNAARLQLCSICGLVISKALHRGERA